MAFDTFSALGLSPSCYRKSCVRLSSSELKRRSFGLSQLLLPTPFRDWIWGTSGEGPLSLPKREGRKRPPPAAVPKSECPRKAHSRLPSAPKARHLLRLLGFTAPCFVFPFSLAGDVSPRGSDAPGRRLGSGPWRLHFYRRPRSNISSSSNNGVPIGRRALRSGSFRRLRREPEPLERAGGPDAAEVGRPAETERVLGPGIAGASALQPGMETSRPLPCISSARNSTQPSRFLLPSLGKREEGAKSLDLIFLRNLFIFFSF